MKRFFAKLFVFTMVMASPMLALAAEPGKVGVADILDKLLKPLGLLTFCLFAVTFVLGMRMSKNRKLFFKLHRKFAYVAVAIGALHGLLVITVEFILK